MEYYHLVKVLDMKKMCVFCGVSTITRPCRVTRISACRKYVQLLLGIGFGGVEDCSIHEQSGVMRLTEIGGSARLSEDSVGSRLGFDGDCDEAG